ncbi:MAG: hypothetical protein IJV31_02725 [Clostridia bacterium]|nr:hypothetical protein [Clostridia bacterium]
MVEVNLNCESDTKPEKYVIENVLNGKCDIILNENIAEKTREDEDGKTKTYFTYDMYRISKNNYRDTLETDLADNTNFAVWLNFAKEQYAKQIIEISDNERIAALEQAIIDIGEVIGND